MRPTAAWHGPRGPRDRRMVLKRTSGPKPLCRQDAEFVPAVSIFNMLADKFSTLRVKCKREHAAGRLPAGCQAPRLAVRICSIPARTYRMVKFAARKRSVEQRRGRGEKDGKGVNATLRKLFHR